MREAVAGLVAPVPDDVVSLGALREWLAGRHLGLVPVEDAERFSWPGHWIGVTSAGRAVVMFGAPSGPVDADLAAGEILVGGWVVASHDLSLDRHSASVYGVVEAIVLAADREAPARVVARAEALAGAGLVGDRYHAGRGTFSGPGVGQQLTLIAAEALDGAGVSAVAARRNVVTRGVDLDGLIGRRFRIGEVECVGRRRAEPCAHLKRLSGLEILRALVHRGGLRADILGGGSIAAGDPVAPVD